MGGNKSKIEDKDRIDERAVMDTSNKYILYYCLFYIMNIIYYIEKVAVYHLNYDEDNTGLVQGMSLLNNITINIKQKIYNLRYREQIFGIIESSRI